MNQQNFHKPYENYLIDIDNWDAEEKSRHDVVWKWLKTLSPTLKRSAPTWAGYNSLIRKSQAVTTASLLLVFNWSATNWKNLYTTIKAADGVRETIYSEGKRIISFGLQLCIKAIQLQEKPDIKEGCAFRTFELFVVFYAAKVLKKMIDGSDLDQIFEFDLVSTYVYLEEIRFLGFDTSQY